MEQTFQCCNEHHPVQNRTEINHENYYYKEQVLHLDEKSAGVHDLYHHSQRCISSKSPLSDRFPITGVVSQ